MVPELLVQRILHLFEQGAGVVWLRRFLIVSAVGAVSAVMLLNKFNGFSTAAAMDYAQIGRQIAMGRGYTTLQARPLALHMMMRDGNRPPSPLPEVNAGPLMPFLNAATLWVVGGDKVISDTLIVSPKERSIAFVSFLFFAASLVLCYRIGCRLFDPKLALIGTGLIIATNIFWRFTLSGLPQMPMLFFFTSSMLALIMAMDANRDEKRRKAFLLTLAAAFLLGIMTLGNGLGLWFLPGFWLFAVSAIRPKRWIALAIPVAFVLPLIPWGLHNWQAVHNLFGLPFYELLRPSNTDALALQSDLDPILRFHLADFANNTAKQALSQISGIISFFDGNVVAAAFFLGVILQTFQRWQAAQFRWVILLMWLGAFLGMSLFGVGGDVTVNQLHVLFLPLMIFYGLSFLLSLWDRLELDSPLLRTGFIVILFSIVAIPLVLHLVARPSRINWPPYFPSLIMHFNEWITPEEAMASDIPWATAWYAERTSLLLPARLHQFELIHSEKLLHAPLVGIYLTPFSSGQRTYADIVNGRYEDWARFVLHEIRPEELKGWLINAAVKLPFEDQSIFYADRIRWQ